MWTGGRRALVSLTDSEAGRDRPGQCGCALCEPVRGAVGVLPLRSCLPAEAEYFARGGMGVGGLSRLARQTGFGAAGHRISGRTVAPPALDCGGCVPSSVCLVQRPHLHPLSVPTCHRGGAPAGQTSGLCAPLSSGSGYTPDQCTRDLLDDRRDGLLLAINRPVTAYRCRTVPRRGSPLPENTSAGRPHVEFLSVVRLLGS